MDAQLTKTGVDKACDTSHGLLYLPEELQIEVLSYVLVANLPFVDPLPPKKLVRHRSSDGKLLMSEMINQGATLYATTTAVKENSRTFDTPIKRALSAMAGDDQTAQRQGIFLNVLCVNRHCLEQSTKVLYWHNTLMFSNPVALECFTRYYPEAARKVSNVLMLLTLHHNSSLLRHFSNPSLRRGRIYYPHYRCDDWYCGETHYLSECPSNPVFVKYEGITSPGGRLSGAFAALRSLTLHIIDALRVEKRESVVLVRKGRGVDLTNWARAIASGGWKVAVPRISGLESLEDQTVVEEAVELLRAS